MIKQDNFELLLSTEEMGESRDEGRKLKVLMGTCGTFSCAVAQCLCLCDYRARALEKTEYLGHIYVNALIDLG